MLTIAKRAGRVQRDTLQTGTRTSQASFALWWSVTLQPSPSRLRASMEAGRPVAKVLKEIGPKLLSMLTSKRAIALNRAAAVEASESGALGRALAKAGRGSVRPLVVKVLEEAVGPDEAETAADILFVSPHWRRARAAHHGRQRLANEGGNRCPRRAGDEKPVPPLSAALSDRVCRERWSVCVTSNRRWFRNDPALCENAPPSRDWCCPLVLRHQVALHLRLHDLTQGGQAPCVALSEGRETALRRLSVTAQFVRGQTKHSNPCRML